ncbi:RsmE family RNA methyltransferase [Treponema sp. OMZ 840]|uniref:RsmE family RNA methyltransferase n=1 Tax=Treponema sp. OMZ 840 TaxID=244313 RepID=UPI003D8E8363
MRQFISSVVPDAGGRIVLDKKEYRYLSRVLRLADGSIIDVRFADGSFVPMRFCTDKASAFLVRCGPDTEQNALTAAADKVFGQKGCEQKTFEQTGCEQTGGIELCLIQFLPKVQKMDLIVRQATECGVSRIIPVIGDYSSPYSPRIDRWQRIIREARQQSGSAVATSITEPLRVEKAAALYCNADGRCSEKNASADKDRVSGQNAVLKAAFMLCEREEGTQDVFSLIEKTVRSFYARNFQDKNGAPMSTLHVLPPLASCRVFLAVGCEGGISPAEKKVLEQSAFMPIHFKTNILRCETAALYGIAAIQSALTEYTKWKSKE